MTRLLRPFFALVAFVLALVAPRLCRAHEVGLSRGDYRVDGQTLVAELIFARNELKILVPALDEDGDGALDATELQHARDALARAVTARIEVRGGDGPCEGLLDDVQLLEEDGLSLRSVYRCPSTPRALRVRLDLLDDLPHGHRHLARTEAGGVPNEMVLFGKTRELLVVGSNEKKPGGAKNAPPRQPKRGDFFGFLRMGIEHILFGYDHLVFLVGLVLVGGRLRALLLVVTAFTVAHSITLGLAVLGVFAPSGRVVEPLIALSVAYVGIENQFVKDAEKRFLITFPFGLVHGFGFAGALGEISLPKAEIPAALVAFNLGVEAGQLAVLALVLPLILHARKKDWFKDKGVKLTSLGIAALGLVWFVLRIVSP